MSARSEDDGEKKNQKILKPSAHDNEDSDEGDIALKKGPWTATEDAILVDYVQKNGEGNWTNVQKNSGLPRCGKSCRLRWINHLKPDLKKYALSEEEERRIVELHAKYGNKWAKIATEFPGRTDNDIKNFWNTRTKRLQRKGKPIYPSGIVPEHSTESGEFDMLDRHTSGSSHLNVLQECNVQIPLPNLDIGKLQRHYSLPSLTSSLHNVPSLCWPERNRPSDSYDLSSPLVHPLKRLRQTEASFPFVNVHEMNKIPSVGQYVYSPEVVAESLVVPSPQFLGCVSPNTSCFRQPLSDVVPGSHAIRIGNFPSSEFSFEAPKMELPSLQYPDAWLSSQSAPLSPFASAAHPHSLNQSPPAYPCQPVHPSPPGGTGLLGDIVYKAKCFPSLEKGSSPQITDVSAGVVPTMDVNQSLYSPLGGNASFMTDACIPISAQKNSAEEHQPFDPDGDVLRFLNEMEEPSEMDKSSPDDVLNFSWFR